MNGRFVAYYRVSRESQGANGNGMAAQRKAVAEYLNGGDWKLVAEFTEVESGKRDDNRPELEKALAVAKKHKATLILAKLDRLARNVHFIAGLMERKVNFVCCDMPSATPFMLHVYAAGRIQRPCPADELRSANGTWICGVRQWRRVQGVSAAS